MKKPISYLVMYSLLFIFVDNSMAQASDKKNEEPAMTVESDVTSFFNRFISEKAPVTEGMPNAKILITSNGLNKCFQLYATWPNESKAANIPFELFIFEECIDRMHHLLKPEYIPDDRFARKHFLAIKSSPDCPSDRVYLRYQIKQKDIMIVMDEVNTHIFCTNMQQHINRSESSAVTTEILTNLKEVLNFNFDSLKPKITFGKDMENIGIFIGIEYPYQPYKEFTYKSHWQGLLSSKEFYIHIPYQSAAARVPVLDDWFHNSDPTYAIVVDGNKADRFEPELTWDSLPKPMYDSKSIKIIVPRNYRNVFMKQKPKNFKILIRRLEDEKMFDIKVTPLSNQNEVAEDIEIFLEDNDFKPYIGDLHLKVLDGSKREQKPPIDTNSRLKRGD